MRQPSKKSLAAAEEILDHVNYGLTRADVIGEWAELIDEGNLPLIEAANDLIDSADANRGLPDARYVRKLRGILAEYQAQQLDDFRGTGRVSAPPSTAPANSPASE